ncbi:hypothetical protein [Streptomyces capillispiralis]|uniref:Uncharacterized protein n=1 Tax=Streptomyces capillispiralis TaxID=68182 RepID=A0A561THT1_9ACTN|nr:hypothetical protein [Streptomyces capillispiralis]TWF86675.1 hypothetical protein FHX78_113663 [Streptomyces capillispiralis]GHH90921.1 hypothetical protein GCM10017779_13780 [Streptomyces capillispiralis]
MTEQQQTALPAPPEHPPAVPGPPVPEQPPAVPGPSGPRDRRVLRAVLRWTAAVVVFAAVGAGAAYGITGMERTDVPGLATASDGRWEYPPLTKPPLPSGSPGPQAESNPAGTHHADLRALLLPAPRGAREDKALRGADGWLETEVFLKEYAAKEDRDQFRQQLVDGGLRHIAARGWTTADGTRTRVYLLQFDTAAVVEDTFFRPLFPFSAPSHPVRGAAVVGPDETFPDQSAVAGVQRRAYVENEPYAAEQDRQAYLAAGDVLAVVLQSRKGTAPAVPFRQTVVLQSQLLG